MRGSSASSIGAESSAEGACLSDAATLARLGVELEKRSVELDLARKSAERLTNRVRRLEGDLAIVEEMLNSLQKKLDDRDRLLASIFESRSWKLMQSLRQLLGR